MRRQGVQSCRRARSVRAACGQGRGVLFSMPLLIFYFSIRAAACRTDERFTKRRKAFLDSSSYHLFDRRFFHLPKRFFSRPYFRSGLPVFPRGKKPVRPVFWKSLDIVAQNHCFYRIIAHDPDRKDNLKCFSTRAVMKWMLSHAKTLPSPSVQKKPERGNLQSSTVPVRGEEGESKEDGGNEKRVL